MRACVRVVRGCPSSAVFAACRALDAQERGDVREAAAAPLSLSSSCPFFQHHLGLASLPPRLFSSPFRRSTFPGASRGKLPPSGSRRGADRLGSFRLCGGFFFLWAPAGAPVGQPRRAWMSRRSDTRRWSCCCFASPCGYCNTIQPEQTPSFTSVRFKAERKRAERRPEIDCCGMFVLLGCNLVDLGALVGRCWKSYSLSNTLKSCRLRCRLRLVRQRRRRSLGSGRREEQAQPGRLRSASG